MIAVAYFFIIGFAIGYVFLILYIIDGWDKTTSSLEMQDFHSSIGVSVVVAARNEENHLLACVKSILANQTTAPFEVIVVNDHSTDKTLEVLHSIINDKLRVINLPEGLKGKKAAITYALEKANYNLILCTDADCTVSPTWINAHQIYHADNNTNIQTGLVIPKDEDTILSRFQLLDFVATMAITTNGINRKQYFLANGANLCYKKSFFNEVNGFDGNEKIASGDDVFLMGKAVSDDVCKIGFLKSTDALVTTKSEQTWKALLNQRKRWASKAMKTSDKNVVKIQGFVFLFCFVILLSMIISPSIMPVVWFAGLTALMIKMAVDYLFLSKLTTYFGQRQVMKSFIPVFFIYFVHILYSGVVALFPTSYEWKERSRA
jgi:cellulose synthase/poly-beta-1,6-N-acetylglucosamine synthase-like glycosyltransferase